MSTVEQHGHAGLRALEGSRSKYILTSDLRASIKRLALGLGLKAPDSSDEIFGHVTSELKCALERHVKSVEVVPIDAEDLGHSVLERARQFGARCHIVSTCTEVTRDGYANTLEINRLVDLDGEIIGLGPRPGHASLAEQARRQVQIAAGRPIVIAEDGVFTGNTLKCVIETFKRQGAVVKAAVSGFIFDQALGFGGGLHDLCDSVEFVQTIDHDHGLFEWMPDHDFLPLIPNCGRVLGTKLGPLCLPYYDQDGTSYSIPYLYPFCEMKKWASITGDTKELTRTCLGLVKKIYEHLKSLNGGTNIYLGDLFANRIDPHISIPFEHGHCDDILGIPTPGTIALRNTHRLQTTVPNYLQFLSERIPS
jgi:hypothetical protein